MKLPEHYEEWMDGLDLMSDGGLLDPFFKEGARAMYHKLMEDMRPAIEALKVALSYMDRTAISPTGVVDLATVDAALSRLKEKGLVEDMEWDFEIKIKLWNFALLRRKDKFMRKGLKRWALARKKDGYWGAV